MAQESSTSVLKLYCGTGIDSELADLKTARSARAEVESFLRDHDEEKPTPVQSSIMTPPQCLPEDRSTPPVVDVDALFTPNEPVPAPAVVVPTQVVPIQPPVPLAEATTKKRDAPDPAPAPATADPAPVAIATPDPAPVPAEVTSVDEPNDAPEPAVKKRRLTRAEYEAKMAVMEGKRKAKAARRAARSNRKVATTAEAPTTTTDDAEMPPAEAAPAPTVVVEAQGVVAAKPDLAPPVQAQDNGTAKPELAQDTDTAKPELAAPAQAPDDVEMAPIKKKLTRAEYEAKLAVIEEKRKAKAARREARASRKVAAPARPKAATTTKKAAPKRLLTREQRDKKLAFIAAKKEKKRKAKLERKHAKFVADSVSEDSDGSGDTFADRFLHDIPNAEQSDDSCVVDDDHESYESGAEDALRKDDEEYAKAKDIASSDSDPDEDTETRRKRKSQSAAGKAHARNLMAEDVSTRLKHANTSAKRAARKLFDSDDEDEDAAAAASGSMPEVHADAWQNTDDLRKPAPQLLAAMVSAGRSAKQVIACGSGASTNTMEPIGFGSNRFSAQKTTTTTTTPEDAASEAAPRRGRVRLGPYLLMCIDARGEAQAAKTWDDARRGLTDEVVDTVLRGMFEPVSGTPQVPFTPPAIGAADGDRLVFRQLELGEDNKLVCKRFARNMSSGGGRKVDVTIERSLTVTFPPNMPEDTGIPPEGSPPAAAQRLIAYLLT